MDHATHSRTTLSELSRLSPQWRRSSGNAELLAASFPLGRPGTVKPMTMLLIVLALLLCWTRRRGARTPRPVNPSDGQDANRPQSYCDFLRLSIQEPNRAIEAHTFYHRAELFEDLILAL